MAENVLLAERISLYKELLDSTNEQRDAIQNRSLQMKEEEDFLPFFSTYFENWDRSVQEIEELDDQLGSVEISEQELKQLHEMISAISENVTFIQNHLEETTEITGSSLRGVRNQQKVLNAYYHLDSKDYIPLYFDAKK